MPSQSDVRKRRLQATGPPADRTARHTYQRRRHRTLVWFVAVMVIVMMVASLAVGLLA